MHVLCREPVQSHPNVIFRAKMRYNSGMKSLFRNAYHSHEPLWHAQVAMLVAIALQLLLPHTYVIGSRYVLVAIELVLLLALTFTTPREKVFRSLRRRVNVYLLLFLSALANAYSLLQVSDKLLTQGEVQNGRLLITTALNIYLTNVILFGLAYWEMDAGGPGSRRQAQKHEKDFLFPQNQNEKYMHAEWQPTFTDYLYVSSTNAMAFSPTDTLPLSRRAKLLMLLQASISVIIVLLVAARAVSILQ
jgi:uncharacterized membrane protein